MSLVSQRRILVLSLVIVSVGQIFGASILTGVVTDTNRRPIPGAKVQILSQFSELFFPEFWKPGEETATDDQGRFSLGISETTPTLIIAWANGYRRTKFALSPAVLAKGHTVGLALEHGERVAGIVEDEAGQPVSGAEVGPIVGSIDMEPAIARRHVPQWTVTGSDGRFEFDGLMPKQPYQFLVRKPGYEIQNVMVQAGQTDVRVQLRKGGHSIGGMVRSRSQDPQTFAGQLLRFNGNGFDLIVKADEHGHFQVDGMPAGNFSLEAIVPSPRISRVLTLEFPRDAARNVTVEVSDGYFLEGTTLDAETSTPVGGVSLRIEDLRTTSDAHGYFRIGPLWQTGKPWIEIEEESGFAVAAPPPGALSRNEDADGFRNLVGQTVWVRRLARLHVNIQGLEFTTRSLTMYFAPKDGKLISQGVTTSPTRLRLRETSEGWLYASDGFEWSSPLLKVSLAPNSKDSAVTLTLHNAASVRGFIRSKSVSESAESTTGPRLLARIFAVQDENGNGVGWIGEVECKQDGSFRFPCLPSGEMLLEATKVGSAIRKTSALVLRPGENREVVIELEAGKLFAGSVRDENQQPVGGATVLYYVRMPDGSTRASKVECSPDGKFLVPEVEGDTIELVRVDHSGFAPWEKRDVPLPCDHLEIVLKSRASLRLKVEADPTTQWKVYLMRIQPWGSGTHAKQLQGLPISEITAIGGQEEAIPGPPEGTYRLVAIDAAHSVGVSGPVAWDPTNPPPMPIRIVPGATGSLRGTLEGGEEVVAEVVATNMVLPDGKCTTEFSAMAQNGTFSFPALPPGDYLVLVTSESYNASAENVRVGSGRVTEIKLRPLRLGSIQGKVLKDKAPVEGANLELVSQTDPDFTPRKTVSSSDGSFAFEDLPPDLYLIRVTVQDQGQQRSGQKSARVTSDELSSQIEIDLTPPPRISFALPPQFAVLPGQPVQMLNRDTGQLIQPKWHGNVLEAELLPGLYSVSIGDAAVGDVRVNPDGTVEAAE